MLMCAESWHADQCGVQACRPVLQASILVYVLAACPLQKQAVLAFALP